MGVSREEVEEFLRLVGSSAAPEKVMAVLRGEKVQSGAGARKLASLLAILKDLEPPPGLEEEVRALRRKLENTLKDTPEEGSEKNAVKIIRAVKNGGWVPKNALSPTSLVLAARALNVDLRELVSRIREIRQDRPGRRKKREPTISLVKTIRLLASGRVPEDIDPDRLRAAQEFLEVTEDVRQELGLSLEGLNRSKIALLLLLAKLEGKELSSWMERRISEIRVGPPDPGLLEAIRSRNYSKIPSHIKPWEIVRLSRATGLKPSEIKEIMREASWQRELASERQWKRDMEFLNTLKEKTGEDHPLYLLMHRVVTGEWPGKRPPRNIMDSLVSSRLFRETFGTAAPLDFNVALDRMLKRLGIEFSPPSIPPYMKEMYRRALHGRGREEKE